jgi:hypothetical protein
VRGIRPNRTLNPHWYIQARLATLVAPEPHGRDEDPAAVVEHGVDQTLSRTENGVRS